MFSFVKKFYIKNLSDYSEVFGTCSKNDIRIWNSKTRQEMLRIHVPNLECFCIGFMRDGKSIYSGDIRQYATSNGNRRNCRLS